jgi:hypothetical protein
MALLSKTCELSAISFQQAAKDKKIGLVVG